ncbi:MAG: exodeoxyribonuclease V subunit gamma [Verrucomicrobiota bacterium]
MNGLFLHTGNRLETLAAELAAVTSVPLGSPFTREIVMVQSLGMRRWLSLQLAEQVGICMNGAFPFPRTFLDDTLRRLVPEMAAPDAFAPDLLTWKIHRMLPVLLHRPEFAPVSAYAADDDGLKLYQLATRLAALFDQYLVYRPEMLLEWERQAADLFAPKGDAAWQATLWRELNRSRELHFGAVLERLKEGRFAPDAQWPERVSIFGISSLPPAQMEVFLALAAHCPVHLFLLAPSREYHGDDLTPKQRARRGLAPDGEGHPLLTSLGKLNAQFTNVLLEADERAGHRIVNASESFLEPTGGSLLHGLQRDILHAQSRGALSGEEAQTVAADDTSLQLHVCHSPMREVEVLYDQLLSLLAEDPTLKPRDILVMTPEIERYAPLIHAVFGCPEDAALRIPYSIADRQPRSDSPAIHTFLSLLECVGTRFTAPEGFALLQSPVFRQKFGFDDAELARLRHWIDASGIRWGIDAAHRAALDLPDFAENTWRHGIDRLLLGYAMPGANRTLFEGILPQDDVEGGEAELLGRFVAAMESVFSTLALLDQARPLGEWPGVLRTVIERFFEESDEDEMRDVRALREAVARLEFIAQEAGPEQSVEFPAMREHFAGLMGEAEQRGGFLTGGVTFCALKPMRSIPARVIWLMGMNEAVFPRRPQPPQFDLMSAEPKSGDRSPRDDDRYLFLEALLSARDRLRISHVGRSLVNHDKLPPSVVVSELLDYLDQSCIFPNGANARETLVIAHRLHAFSRSYFTPGGRLFSYSTANGAAAAVRAVSSTPFITKPLPEPAAELRNVALADLLAFIVNPAAFFLRRLGIRLDESNDTLEETEPLTPDNLQLYHVGSELFDARIAGAALPGEEALFARALLPPGSVGTQYYRDQDASAKALQSTIASLLPTTTRDEPRLIDLRIGAFTLTGRIEALYNGRLAFFRPAKLKPKDRLRAWTSHLAWCAACDAAPPPAILAGAGEAVQFNAQAPDQLEALLELYWLGLQTPLPFFPKTSLEFVAKQSSKGDPLERARAIWRGSVRSKPESDDPAFRLCFGEAAEPLDAEFERLALAIYAPMLNAEEAAT